MAKTFEDLDAIRRYLSKLEDSKKMEDTARKQILEKRLSGNLALVAELEEKVKEHPELRFGQLLFIMFCNDNGELDSNKLFNDEPDKLMETFKKNEERWQKK